MLYTLVIFVDKVRVTASWALANICDSLRHRAIVLKIGAYTDGESRFETLSLIVETALRLTKDGDKVKSNAVRALGHLSRFLSFNCYSVANEAIKNINVCNENGLPVYVDPRWLERMVQAFLSCVTTGNVKVQWNVCYALSNLFMNDTLKLHDTHWAPTVYSILLLLLRDSTNYKIRIHAAVALAVPASRLDYGSSFSDVVQGLEHVLESLGSHQSVVPSSFKYKDNLEKQLSLTTLHVLGFASSEDGPALKDFLFKKAMFFEGWFKFLCASLLEGQDKASAMSADASSAPQFLPDKAKAVHDGTRAFFMLQVDGEYAYSQGVNEKCPSVALMFQVGENASYYNMGGCKDLPGSCSSRSCRGHEVDIMHFSIGNAIPGRLYGGNPVDNFEGTGGDRFGHLTDIYAWNPHCLYLDGKGPSGNSSYAQNDWQGAWWHSMISFHSGLVEEDSPYSEGGSKGTYFFEFSRPLRTMDLSQQDVQFVIGQKSQMAAAFWYPSGGKPWTKSQHYSASCNWLALDIAASSLSSSKDSWDSATAFALLLSGMALCISVFAGCWVAKNKAVPFTPIDRL